MPWTVSEGRAKRLTPQERQRLVERWDRLYDEFTALAARQTADGTERRDRLLREMDQVALRLREDWLVELRQEMEGSG